MEKLEELFENISGTNCVNWWEEAIALVSPLWIELNDKEKTFSLCKIFDAIYSMGIEDYTEYKIILEKNSLTNVSDKDMFCGLMELLNERWDMCNSYWKDATKHTPPSKKELLAKAPDGTIHLTKYLQYGRIIDCKFECQDKNGNFEGWRWKHIY